MRKEKRSLSRLFVIPVILSLVAVSSFACTVQTQISGVTPENILSASQSNLDRSIGILNTVAQLMGVLVGLLTAILAVVASFGFLEYRRWQDIRKSAEELAAKAKRTLEEAEKSAQEARQCADEAKPIVDRLKQIEKEAQTIRKNIVAEIPTLGEALPEETKKKLEELGKKVEFLEGFGVEPKFEDYLARAAKFYYAGKYDLALEAVDKAIELKPDDASAWYNKGVALGELGRHEEALKAFDKAIELKPDYASAWNNKGVALGKLGRHEEALKAYDKAIELKPDDASAWYNKACVYSLKGDKGNALKTLSRAIELDAKNKEQAKKDEDFRNLWDDQDFKKLTG